MQIERFILGPLQTNSYLITNERYALWIDPAGKSDKCIQILKEHVLEGILLTHGHFDHIKAVDGLYERYQCPVFLNELDEKMARDKLSGKDFGIVSYIACPTISLPDGFHSTKHFEFEVIKALGHTEGSVLYRFGNALFTGDTLFKNSCGRTDLIGGSQRKLNDTLRIFKQMTQDFDLYPGHDELTTLSCELLYNPYLK